MAKKARPQPAPLIPKRRRFTDDFRREAVLMMLDEHSAPSVAERLGITCTTLVYRWKQQHLRQGGPVASSQSTGWSTRCDERVVSHGLLRSLSRAQAMH